MRRILPLMAGFVLVAGTGLAKRATSVRLWGASHWERKDMRRQRAFILASFWSLMPYRRFNARRGLSPTHRLRARLAADRGRGRIGGRDWYRHMWRRRASPIRKPLLATLGGSLRRRCWWRGI